VRFEYPDEITSDQMFRAFGQTLQELLINAAMAMFGVMYDLEEIEPEIAIKVEATGIDKEKLLYDWLSNLLIEFEVEGVFFTSFSIESLKKTPETEFHVIGTAKGSRKMPELRTHVKGVTLHRFALERVKNEYVATVVVDV
jgi:SHS2 domain-containing protein